MKRPLGRREFLQSGAALAAGMGAAQYVAAEEKPAGEVYREPARDVPIVDRADVVVCGAGPAGVAAAIAAARAGASTRLIEAGGCLGGTWTAGLLCWILDSNNKSGIMKEILARLGQREGMHRYGGDVGYDVEQMKRLLEQMCLESDVKLRLHTRIVSAACDESKRLNLAVTESKSGREAFGGKIFVDCTGDGDLSAYAGASFDYGEEGTGRLQPMSMMALLVGLDPEAVALFVRGLAEPRGEKDPKTRFLKEMERAGVTPSYTRPTLFHLVHGIFCLATNHQYGVSATDAGDITSATLQARIEVHKIVDALRKLGEPWKNVRIAATPEHIGVREGRRVRGLYQVTKEDLSGGVQHEDSVCRVTFPVDIHSPDPTKDKGIVRAGVRAKPYDIPYRSLVAKDVRGLLTAGRCISGDFVAHSSYRVTGNAAALGEAAGTAAAIAALSNRLPEQVPFAELAAKLQPAKE